VRLDCPVDNRSIARKRDHRELHKVDTWAGGRGALHVVALRDCPERSHHALRCHRARLDDGHEVSGIVASVILGTTGLQVGDEVYGLTDWYRDGAAAELFAVEARNLALRPRSVDHVASSMLPVAGLAAWQALFRHGRLEPGQTLLVLGAGGGVGNFAVQMAHHAGAEVIGIGRAHDRTVAIAAGASTFIDLDDATLPNLDGASLAFDTVGGEVATTVSSGLGPTVRMVSIVDDHAVGAMGSQGTFFVVEPDREDLTKIATMVDEGSLRPTVGRCSTLSEGPELMGAKEAGRVQGKVSIRIG